MKQFIKAYWKTLAFFVLVGLVGGFFTGLFMLETYPEEMRQQLLESVEASGLGQVPVDILLGIMTAGQAAGYGLVLGALGIWLGKKIGLWRDERRIEKNPLLAALVVAVVGGLGMILPDLLFFGKHSQMIMDSYAVKPSLPFVLASVTYGAVIEEVMLRLFAMSLLAFLLHKLFGRKNEMPATAILIAANVVAAVLFAAGHMPATVMTIGTSPLIIFRCFALNGGLGLLFGFLYRKYGLRYAMIAHGGCHILSKLIWLLFVS